MRFLCATFVCPGASRELWWRFCSGMGQSQQKPWNLTSPYFSGICHVCPWCSGESQHHSSRHYLYLHLTLKLQPRHASPECANIPFRTSKRCPGVKSRQIFTTLMLFSCEPRGLNCVECKPFAFSCGVWCSELFPFKPPNPAVRPISHFHSCSSPCGLQLKIAKRRKGGLNFIRWWQIYSSITGERRTLCAHMTVLHSSNARNRAEPVLTEKKGDGGRFLRHSPSLLRQTVLLKHDN